MEEIDHDILGWKSRDSVPKLVDAYLSGNLKVDEFVTHSFPLESINEAFDVMHAGKRYITSQTTTFRLHE